MKKTSVMWLRAWGWFRMSIILAVVVCVLIFIRDAYLHSDCGHTSRTIFSGNSKYEAVVEEEACGSGSTVTIKVRKRGAWFVETLVFAYTPTNIYEKNRTWTHDPVVSWLSPVELEIAIDRIGHIEREVTETHGIKIKYKIGSVDNS
jgi:hypothetical protein